MVLPLFITTERDDPHVREIADVVFETLEQIGGVRIPRDHKGAGPWGTGKYSSTAWYVSQALDRARGQVNLEELWTLYNEEPWQNDPHHELVLLESDLFAPGMNFLYGETRPTITNDGQPYADFSSQGHRMLVKGSIQSASRIRRYGKHFPGAFFGIILHELGHFYGLASATNPHLSAGNDGLFGGHCDDRHCIMEQVNVQGKLDLGEKIRIVSQHNPRWFCDADYAALQRNLRRLYTQ